MMIVVAVVVTIYTAGALAAAGSLGSNALGAAALSGAGGSAGIGAAVAGGIAGGALGSITSQAVGNMTGVQDGFSWKGVALSALAGGVSGGLGGASIDNLVLRSAVGSAMSQGVAVVTGLQSNFNWKAVAASAAGAAASNAMGSALDGSFKDWNQAAAGIARGTLNGLAAGTVAAIAKGGRISVQQVATDAFGNALAWSMVSASQQPSPSSSPTDINEALTRAFEKSEQNAAATRVGSGVQIAQADLSIGEKRYQDGNYLEGAGLDGTQPVVTVTAQREQGGSSWVNPFADPGAFELQWTVGGAGRSFAQAGPPDKMSIEPISPPVMVSQCRSSELLSASGS
ncbi:MAG: hypothetical protein EOP24_32460 [Hyphomicrobiales bacterium]|nr:MAG: hypothetical protein EOP24_32460 [Hyphomicrobiales bacterium]